MSNQFHQDQEAVEIRAQELNIGSVTEDHWRVVNFVRDCYVNHGWGPTPYEIYKC